MAGAPGGPRDPVAISKEVVPVERRQELLQVSEANLGILGLGVAEPLPSWGSLLRELEGLVSVGAESWRFVPLVLLVIVVTSFQLVLSRQDEVAA